LDWAAKEHGLALTLMIGVRRGVNLALCGAGDNMDRADVAAVEGLCAYSPDVKLFVTFLSRENQHTLCVAARRFNNLMPFGCWWFLNTPSIVYEITRERIELLGSSFAPQHSDARVLEQLIYKWKHARTELPRPCTSRMSNSCIAVVLSLPTKSRAMLIKCFPGILMSGSALQVRISPALERPLAERGIA
jgi:hypothetical protein